MEDVKTVGKNRTTDLKSGDGGITYSYETIHPPSKKLSTLYYLNAGLVHWLFSFCFLWTLWNNQLSSFDARRLLRSLAILFGTAFVLKHLLLASLYSPEGGWLQRMAGTLLQGVAIGTLDAPTFAPVTGYIAFLTLSLYVAGLILLALAVNSKTGMVSHTLVDECRQLSVAERQAVREVILDDPGDQGLKQKFFRCGSGCSRSREF